ncbi:hydrogenase small subunit [Magnetospira sp. QH-2]|uniref:hydrogenase small subunit n=1 Tax=Magnetospira sp. (strain QH-2) TaxID=1288970 RepID=UPI0003E81165|nr:hydrogenase small subunit [Magnetospira sp. QH-2]CCQ72244.1 Hydrogenase. Hydrogen:quinone oxidoreductase (Nickel-Iron NiFe hydrogenase), small subunit [Magnetospira sp. QH-2]
MGNNKTLTEVLQSRGVSRRGFLKYCAGLASIMALPPAMAPRIAAALESQRRPSVIWLSFQECTGCTEALTRSHSPTLEELILNVISLDYHHTLQAASGHAAEAAREQAMHENKGKYLVLVDGSIPVGNPGFSTIAGISNKDMLLDTVKDAAAVVSIGTCAAYGGLPKANPNPTGAVAVTDLVKDKPVINVPGCPPIPVVMTAVLAHYLTFGTIPELDAQGRPKAFYGETIHDRCYRRTFYDQGKFAKGFDDEGARKGWCLFELGCKGPVTYNACATVKWNDGTSFPIQAGHGCIGCSQPDFWDAGGFYDALSIPNGSSYATAGAAAAGGVAAGAVMAVANTAKRKKAAANREPVTIEDLKGEG